MYVTALVTEGVDPRGLLAPQQGVSRDERGRPTALVVDARGRAQLRDLRLGRAVGDNWLVLSGLAPGERLIVEGLLKVQPGALVRALPASSPVVGAQAG
jgi:membrane fusion protein (multidrug efflux system)